MDTVMSNNSDWMNNPFIYLIFLSMFNGGGLGGNRDCATQEQVRAVADTQAIVGGIQAQTLALANDTGRLEGDVAGLGDVVQGGIFQNQLGQCNIVQAIDKCCCDARLQTCEQTNSIVNAIRTDGEATRALMNTTRMRDLESQVNRYQTTTDILSAQGRYVSNPPCQLYNGCPCA